MVLINGCQFRSNVIPTTISQKQHGWKRFSQLERSDYYNDGLDGMPVRFNDVDDPTTISTRWMVVPGDGQPNDPGLL
jgi:hypothetical protein